MLKRTIQTIAIAAAAILPCAAAVNTSSPANNATVANPVQVKSSATGSAPITAMALYVDNNLITKVSGATLTTSFTTSNGGHSVVIQAWDSNGAVQKQSLGINVSGGTTGGGGGSLPNAINNIDQKSGWQNCGSCAGPGGQGATVPYSMTQGRSNPSMDGNGTEFWIGGKTPYAAALWWNQLGAQPGASHFIYDMYFYVVNPSAPQALEFDINQSVNGRKYIFGTECNPRGTGQWDVWDAVSSRWIGTGVACAAPSPYTWHHVTIEADRQGTQTHFIAITLDGNKHYINRYYNTQGSGVQELNVAVQLDLNYASTNYSMWTDKISLQYQ